MGEEDVLETGKKEIRKRQFICLLVSSAVFLAVWLSGGQQPLKDGAIHRGNYGEEETEYELWVSGLEETEIPIQLPLTAGNARNRKRRRYGSSGQKICRRRFYRKMLRFMK